MNQPIGIIDLACLLEMGHHFLYDPLSG